MTTYWDVPSFVVEGSWFYIVPQPEDHTVQHGFSMHDRNLTRRSAFAGKCRQGRNRAEQHYRILSICGVIYFSIQQSNQISGIASWVWTMFTSPKHTGWWVEPPWRKIRRYWGDIRTSFNQFGSLWICLVFCVVKIWIMSKSCFCWFIISHLGLSPKMILLLGCIN